MLFATCLATMPTYIQAATIGGTDAGGEATGIMAMFVGDRFENFRNMDRFVPTSTMSPSPTPWNLGTSNESLTYSGELLGKPTSLQQFIELSDTSAFLVFKDGQLIFENYRHGDSVSSLHTSFSVAKSFTSALAGIALAEGHLDSLDDPVRKYLPELTSATFDNVSVKDVLQMSSGVRFTEVYTDPDSDINQLTNLVPPMTYLEYMNTLGRDHEPGTFNHYASINTQLLGILLVRVTGESITDYMTKKLWHPLGMESPGKWVLDEQGFEMTMGGLSASARDYAKLGLLYLNEGRRGDQQILPAPGDNPASSSVSGYQYQWWTPRNRDGDYLARGIWGQNIYVHPDNGVVIVKLAADQKNFDPAYKLAYIDYLQDLAKSLD
jgi:CubicO group peptidase (beta-lactamase class C family)